MVNILCWSSRERERDRTAVGTCANYADIMRYGYERTPVRLQLHFGIPSGWRKCYATHRAA